MLGLTEIVDDEYKVDLVFDINVSTAKFMKILDDINEFASFDFANIEFDDDWVSLTVWYHDDDKDDLDDYVSGNRYVFYKDDIIGTDRRDEMMYR